jgi:hypothetical protein
MRYQVALLKEVAKIRRVILLVFTALQNCHSCSWFGPDLIKEVVRWDDRNKVIPKEGIEAFIAAKAPLMLRLKDGKSLCLSNFVEINSRWQRTRNLQKCCSHQERMLGANIKKQERKRPLPMDVSGHTDDELEDATDLSLSRVT